MLNAERKRSNNFYRNHSPSGQPEWSERYRYRREGRDSDSPPEPLWTADRRTSRLALFLAVMLVAGLVATFIAWDQSKVAQPGPNRPVQPGTGSNFGLPAGNMGDPVVSPPKQAAPPRFAPVKLAVSGSGWQLEQGAPVIPDGFRPGLLAGSLPVPPTPVAQTQTQAGPLVLTPTLDAPKQPAPWPDVVNPPTGRIRAQGAELVDANGQRFFVAGVNYEGHTDRAWLMWQNDKFDPDLIEQNFIQAQAGGYNALRIFVQTQLRDDILANDWKKLDKVVEIAARRGLRLLITFGDYDEPDLNKLIQVDSAVARHYAKSDVILGYDLRNEPQFEDLISNIYPTGQQPPLQTDELIKVYGERVGAGRYGGVPAQLNAQQAYIFANMRSYYQEFQGDMNQWFAARGNTGTPLEFMDSPAAARWKPFLDELDATVRRYIEVRQAAIQQADPGRLITVGWNRPELAWLPANRTLGFISLHRWPGFGLDGFSATFANLDYLKHYFEGEPVVLEEFGYSNSDGSQPVPLNQTASLETAIWLFLYGRGYAGGFKWMLNNFSIGANPYENNLGLTDNQTQPKSAYYGARSVLRLAALHPGPAGDFSRMESYNGQTVSYVWGSSEALFGNQPSFTNARLQITQSEAAPWAVWWPVNGQLYLSVAAPAQITLNLQAIFPTWEPGQKYELEVEGGTSLPPIEQPNPGSLSFKAAPGQLYSFSLPVEPGAFHPAQPLGLDQNLYFNETKHNLSHYFKRYWEANGGLTRFGFPISEEFQENGYTVQYFERARLEYHPEHSGTDSEVELGLLGRLLSTARQAAGETPFQALDSLEENATTGFFRQTGHSLQGSFKAYWESQGGLAQFGYPLSEEFSEVNPLDGKTYVVQYFERARLQRLASAPDTTGIHPGMLGVELARLRGWT